MSRRTIRKDRTAPVPRDVDRSTGRADLVQLTLDAAGVGRRGGGSGGGQTHLDLMVAGGKAVNIARND